MWAFKRRQANHDKMDETKKIEGIPIAEEAKYLGVKIINKKDIFRDQRKNMMKKAQKMTNLANGVIYKRCNKVMIGKTFFGKTLPYQECFIEQMSWP